MEFKASQGPKIVALVIGLYVGIATFLAIAPGIGPFQERAGMMVMVVLSIVGAALVFGRPVVAAALFGAAAALGILIGNSTDVFTRLDMWGFLLLVPAGLAVLAAWEDLDSPDE